MPQLQFQAYTFAGSWLWCFALAAAGKFLGEHWNSDPRMRAVFDCAHVTIVVLVGAASAVWWLKRRRPQR